MRKLEIFSKNHGDCFCTFSAHFLLQECMKTCFRCSLQIFDHLQLEFVSILPCDYSLEICKYLLRKSTLSKPISSIIMTYRLYIGRLQVALSPIMAPRHPMLILAGPNWPVQVPYWTSTGYILVIYRPYIGPRGLVVYYIGPVLSIRDPIVPTSPISTSPILVIPC